MEQEQKPFEIKKLFTVGFGAVSLEKMAQDGLGDLFFNNAMVKKLSQVLIEANAEIRRLQGEVEELEETSKDKDEAIAGLNDQLADAPTWGNWVEAKKDMSDGKPGIYEFKHTDGSTSVMSIGLNSNKVFESFRRLNYTPKPAREVEKKYGDATAKELSMNPHLAKEWSDLAFDLVVLQEKHAAVQAELRELKGER